MCSLGIGSWKPTCQSGQGCLTSDQSAQCLQILHVFAQIFAFRRFEHFGNFAETVIAHDNAERLETDFAPADVLMSIHARAASGFGIVYMNCNETIAPDNAIKFAECLSDC